MAFIEQETVVHFHHFIDLKINFYTNPYNLVSSRLP